MIIRIVASGIPPPPPPPPQNVDYCFMPALRLMIRWVAAVLCASQHTEMRGTMQCSTIHITPEEGFSYASLEVSCTALHDVETARLVRKVAEIFEPAGAPPSSVLILAGPELSAVA